MTSAKRKTFRLVTVGLGSDLYFGESTQVRIQFDLPAGKPRSGSNVRVGPAFATFLAWAFGDQGKRADRRAGRRSRSTSRARR